MPRGWVLLPLSRITLAYTHDDCGEHRALEPYGRRYGTACHRVAEPMPPDGILAGSPTLVRCRECFPEPPADLVATRQAR